MKILVEKDTKLAKFCLYDDQKVTLNKKTDMHGITVLNRNSTSVEFYVSDGIACDETYIVYEDVTDVPEDYVGNKYKYDGTSWTKNENYYDPSKE